MSITFYKIPVADIPMVKVRDEVHNGFFIMGAPDLTNQNAPPCRTHLPEGVDMSLGLITKRQFVAVMSNHPKGREFLKSEINIVYQNNWGYPLNQPQFYDHPMTYVSWEDTTIFFDILNNMLGITNEDEKYRRPTEAEFEFMVRGGWICLQEQAAKENAPLKTWDDFLKFIRGRFENIVAEISENSPILNIGLPSEKKLKDLLEIHHPLWALRVYGSASGYLDESLWYNQPERTNPPHTREIKTIFDQCAVVNSSDYLAQMGALNTCTDDISTLTSEFYNLAEAGRVQPHGLTDPGGNGFTWCEDDWDSIAHLPSNRVSHPLTKNPNRGLKAIRGGAANMPGVTLLRAAYRRDMPYQLRNNFLGFRCARGPVTLR